MAGIYAADIYCDDCVEDIKNRIASELFNGDFNSDMIGHVDTASYPGLMTVQDYRDELDNTDEREYDSDQYPKNCSDDEESDSPLHCGSHDDCLDPTELSDGSKVGHFFENSLTSDGEAYVIEAVREGGLVSDLWKGCYDYLDFEEYSCDHCGDDTDDYGLCYDCEQNQCANCGDVSNDLDCNDECEGCVFGDSDDFCEE